MCITFLFPLWFTHKLFLEKGKRFGGGGVRKKSNEVRSGTAHLLCSVPQQCNRFVGMWRREKMWRVPSLLSPPSPQNLPGPQQAPTPFLPPPQKSPVVLLTISWNESLNCALPIFHPFCKGKLLLSQGSLFSWSPCGWHIPGLTASVAPPALHCRHHVMAQDPQIFGSGVEFLGNSGPRKVTCRDHFKSC